MPVRGAQKNVLELFIRDQSDFAVDPEPDERSGRVLISDDLREKLLQRKRSGVSHCGAWCGFEVCGLSSQ